MAYDILLICDDDEVKNEIIKKISLTRKQDRIEVCPTDSIKAKLKDFMGRIVMVYDENDAILRRIETIKSLEPDCEVIALFSNPNKDILLEAFDFGIYDYFFIGDEEYVLMLKIINCFKYISMKETNDLNDLFLKSVGVKYSKNNLYKIKYIKENFSEIKDNHNIRNGIMCIVTLADEIKTKMSLKRLGLIIKKCLRKVDIAAEKNNSLYYIILKDTDYIGAKRVIDNIQAEIGSDFPVRAGMCCVDNRTFDEVEKNAYDSLQSAIINNELLVSLNHCSCEQKSWLEDVNTEKSKNYKLFKTLYSRKIKNIIEPLFYKFHKENFSNNKKLNVVKYANIEECIFSIQSKNNHSELIITFNGITQISAEIYHKGLDSVENSTFVKPLNKFNEKDLSKWLKQLFKEFKENEKRYKSVSK